VTILVIAPHADDETLGCGGLLLAARANDISTVIVFVTSPKANEKLFTPEYCASRDRHSRSLMKKLNISKDQLISLGYPPTELESISKSKLIKDIQSIIRDTGASQIFLPHPSDPHSDHKVCFEASIAACKWFRSPTVNFIATYETLSETDQNLNPNTSQFHPNYYVDIDEYLEEKLKMAAIYDTEMGEFPFPRSELAIKSLARYRGACSGLMAAEAFQVIYQKTRL